MNQLFSLDTERGGEETGTGRFDEGSGQTGRGLAVKPDIPRVPEEGPGGGGVTLVLGAELGKGALGGEACE